MYLYLYVSPCKENERTLKQRHRIYDSHSHDLLVEKHVYIIHILKFNPLASFENWHRKIVKSIILYNLRAVFTTISFL